MMNDIQVVKRDHLGQEVFRYPGKVLTLDAGYLTLQAEFNYDIVQIEEITLKSGDMFIETYYFDRWYNIFEIHQGTSSLIKAYYCNIGYPAELDNGEVSYRDLALDLFVRPDGRETCWIWMSSKPLNWIPPHGSMRWKGWPAYRHTWPKC